MTTTTTKSNGSNGAATELQTLIRARYPLIWITSNDEKRVESAIAQVAQSLDIGLQLWSCARGFTSPSGEQLGDVPDPFDALSAVVQWSSRCLFTLRDFTPYVDPSNPANVRIIRFLRDAARYLKNQKRDAAKTIIFVSPEVELPAQLQSEVALVRWPLPSTAEIESALDGVLAARSMKLENGAREAVIDAARGMPLCEVENVLARSLVSVGGLDPKIVTLGKKEAIKRSGALEWIDVDRGLGDVGGLGELKSWLGQRRSAFTRKARDFGLPAPKGLLLTGIPGTGKSLAAKAAASALSMPLLRFDVGAAFGSLLGETEARVREVQAVAKAAAPCILWIDEIDKAFAGVGGSSAQTDGGVATRAFGSMLTWLQEKSAPVFAFATANDVSALPPEMLRKGRFDELFFVDLPNMTERDEIWRVHIEKRGRSCADFDLAQLVSESDGFTGAEIEAVFVDALYRAFSADAGDVKTSDVLAALKATKPLSKTASTKLDELRNWSKGRARPASAQVASAVDAQTARFANL